MSDANIVRAPGTLYIISAPSGAGKTSLIKALLQSDPGVVASVSHTTRPMRDGETDGVDYHFVAEDVFRGMQADGAFIESAEVFGNHYGTSRSATLDQLQHGVDVVLEIDWQGARQVRALLPAALSIYILPPSRQALEERLGSRNQDSREVIASRMREAVGEIRHYEEFGYLVVNEDFATALAELKSIILARRLRREPQAIRYREMIEGLLA